MTTTFSNCVKLLKKEIIKSKFFTKKSITELSELYVFVNKVLVNCYRYNTNSPIFKS